MHGYKEFFEDVKLVFADIILDEDPQIEYISDQAFGNYAVRLIFHKSILHIDLDRMDIKATFIDPKNLEEYNILDVIDILCKKLDIPKAFKNPPRTREFIKEYLNLINFALSQCLRFVLNGDYLWRDAYWTMKNEQTTLLKNVLQLDYNHPIYQKFIEGDETWKLDIQHLDNLE